MLPYTSSLFTLVAICILLQTVYAPDPVPYPPYVPTGDQQCIETLSGRSAYSLSFGCCPRVYSTVFVIFFYVWIAMRFSCTTSPQHHNIFIFTFPALVFKFANSP